MLGSPAPAMRVAAGPTRGVDTLRDHSISAAEWEVVYRDGFNRLYRALVATLFDREAALDALHDAFEEGLRNPPPHRENIYGWIFRVALHKARRRWRRRASQVTLRLDSTDSGGIPQTLDRLEVSQLLAQLTERQRAIVIGYFFLDMRQTEIAKSLRIKPGTVAATISQALNRLREVASGVA